MYSFYVDICYCFVFCFVVVIFCNEYNFCILCVVFIYVEYRGFFYFCKMVVVL